LRFLKSGKVKDVYEVSDSELEFVFSDRISVFDKVIPSMCHSRETLADKCVLVRDLQELGNPNTISDGAPRSDEG
jgi:hypothetical protein